MLKQAHHPRNSPERAGGLRGTIPLQITWAVRCLVAFIALNLIVITLLVANRSGIAGTIRQANPTWSQDQVDAFAGSIVIGGSIVHLIFSVLTAWLAIMIRGGRGWARIVITVVLLLNLLIGISVFVSPIAGLPQQAINIFSALLKLAAIGLLWFPQPSRMYFARRGLTS